MYHFSTIYTASSSPSCVVADGYIDQDREMEHEGTTGFHSYYKIHNTSSGLNLQEMNMGSENNGSHHSVSDDNECTVREQDRFMPIANVIRIMRKILPSHAKISDDAKETIQECVSEYISFITGEANDRCQREQRKTITAEDVLWAMSKLGFDDYIEPLTLYLHRYRELDGERSSLRGEPFVLKRSGSSTSVDFNTTTTYGVVANGAAGYGGSSPFYMGRHHHHHGFFGGSTMTGGYLNNDHVSTNNVASSSDIAMPNGDALHSA